MLGLRTRSAIATALLYGFAVACGDEATLVQLRKGEDGGAAGAAAPPRRRFLRAPRAWPTLHAETRQLLRGLHQRDRDEAGPSPLRPVRRAPLDLRLRRHPEHLAG